MNIKIKLNFFSHNKLKFQKEGDLESVCFWNSYNL